MGRHLDERVGWCTGEDLVEVFILCVSAYVYISNLICLCALERDCSS